MNVQIPSSAQALVDESNNTTSFWFIFFQGIYKAIRADLPTKLSGILSVNYTPVSSEGTDPTDLMSYTLPANMMKNDGDYLEIEARGTFAGNANNKQVQLEFGSQTVFDTTALAINGGAWVLKGYISRLSSATETINAEALFNNLARTNAVSGTQDLTMATIIKCVGTGIDDADITQTSFVIKFTPND